MGVPARVWIVLQVLKKSMDVSIRRNVWDCGAQAQDNYGRAGVAVVIRLARLNNDLRRNQKKTLYVGDANDPSKTVRIVEIDYIDIISRSLV